MHAAAATESRVHYRVYSCAAARIIEWKSAYRYRRHLIASLTFYTQERAAWVYDATHA